MFLFFQKKMGVLIFRITGNICILGAQKYLKPNKLFEMTFTPLISFLCCEEVNFKSFEVQTLKKSFICLLVISTRQASPFS